MKALFDSIKIYPKLIVTFLIVLTPLFLLSLVMNQYGSSNIKKEITQSMQSKVHFYNSNLENEFTRTIKLMREFAGYEDLDLLSNRTEIMSYYDQRVAIRNLQKELSVLKNSSNYILEASVHIPAINRTISDDNFGTIPIDEFEALNVVTNIFESPFIYWRDRLFISLPYPIKSNRVSPEFVVEIEISIDLLRNALLQFTDHTTGNTMLVNSEKGWKITGNDNGDIVNEIALIDGSNSDVQGPHSVTIDGQHYLVALEKSNVLGTTLIMYEREQSVLGPLRQYTIWFWMISGLTVIVIVVVSYSVYRLIHQPLKNLVRAFRKVEQGNLNVTFDYQGRDEFQYLYTQFNAMVQNLQQMIYEVYEQKFRVQHAELKQLQSQINPHFLYNSLFILYRLAKKNGDENQIRFTKYLSDYFQFITRNSNHEVTLAEEAQHAKNYVEIQMFRFAHHIEVKFEELPPSCAPIMVPRLILQPIVENAYKHGLEHKESGGKLRVSFELLENSVLIAVEDNGELVGEATIQSLQRRLNDNNVSQETTGLINVHRRLVFRFGPNYGITLSRGNSGGFKVTFRLPAETTTHLSERN
ncbi:sensor histidine kinase [Cohnella silvisoli]|uniref:Histidine kinase n=1 Tax=Cohnella silvisoli TaxID=2873699 RepID=A0ABV1KMK9_9BACL|nr:histidine kinase [Cohnella silvisoli]MCD9020404.1 histidine kinase [Cohnella silvisoli]